MAIPLRILILEDNPSDAELMLNALRHAGYDPIADCAETEQDYRRHLQSAPEVILSDFCMPEFDALRALDIMQESQLDIPVIIVSGSIGEELAEQIMQRGANDYIIKDRLGRLGHVVSQALEQRRLREAKRQAEHALSESEKLARKIEDEKQRQHEVATKAQERTVEINEALMLGALRQHEFTETAQRLNAQLQAEIAARQKGERELSEKARLLDLSNDAIIVHNLDDEITLWNKGAEKLYGWTSEEVVGKPIHALLHTEFPKPITEIAAQLQSEGHYSGEVFQITRDGTRMPLLCRKVLDAGTGSILTSYTNISERKQFEEEREALLANEQALRIESEAANRSKDVFLATLSHEMRTPLNAILGWASIIGREDCTPEELQQGILIIERNVNAQAQLINDVLDVSRIVSGKLQLEIVPSELAVLIKDAIDVVHIAAAAKNIQIKVNLGPVAAPVPCDPHRMRQVLWNLLTNSVKFTPKDGTITVKLTQDHFNARIEIGDNGQGIPADLLPYIFERFRQGEGGTKRQHGGLGLGLSIVKNLIELHGGEISVTSDGAGRGSLFTVNLPLPAPAPQPSSATPNSAQPPRLDGLRILVVDDEPNARNLLVRVLKDVGALAVAAGSVVDALRLIDTASPHILLSDIAMPVQDGYDFIRLVRKSGHLAKDLPAIAITAFVHKDDIRQSLLAGFQMHIAKPIDPYDLITVVASLAGRTGTNP